MTPCRSLNLSIFMELGLSLLSSKEHPTTKLQDQVSVLHAGTARLEQAF